MDSDELACMFEIWPEVFLRHQCICAAQLLAAGAKALGEDSAERVGVHPEGAAVTVLFFPKQLRLLGFSILS